MANIRCIFLQILLPLLALGVVHLPGGCLHGWLSWWHLQPGDRIQVIGTFRCLPAKKNSFTSCTFRWVSSLQWDSMDAEIEGPLSCESGHASFHLLVLGYIRIEPCLLNLLQEIQQYLLFDPFNEMKFFNSPVSKIFLKMAWVLNCNINVCKFGKFDDQCFNLTLTSYSWVGIILFIVFDQDCSVLFRPSKKRERPDVPWI